MSHACSCQLWQEMILWQVKVWSRTFGLEIWYFVLKENVWKNYIIESGLLDHFTLSLRSYIIKITIQLQGWIKRKLAIGIIKSSVMFWLFILKYSNNAVRPCQNINSHDGTIYDSINGPGRPFMLSYFMWPNHLCIDINGPTSTDHLWLA